MERDRVETPIVAQLVKKFPTSTEGGSSFPFDISHPFDAGSKAHESVPYGVPLRSAVHAKDFPEVADTYNNNNNNNNPR